MCQIHSFFIYQSLGNVFLLPFFLVLHLFSTLKVDSSLIFSAFLSRKVCIWRCNWKNGCDAERKAEKNEEKSLAYLHSSTKELFQWYHHHSGWLSVIHFYASSLRKLLKVASAHRENSTHTQAPPTPASAAFSNDVLVKRKPLGPPLCLFFSLQKPIKAKELKKIIHEHKELAAVINAYSKTKLFSSFSSEKSMLVTKS